ncbi:hypothetical protein D3C71_1612900 [compost metagenome]
MASSPKASPTFSGSLPPVINAFRQPSRTSAPADAGISASAGSDWAANSSSRLLPEASAAPAKEPADVPNIASAFPRSTSASDRPSITPISQAIPVTPPPPRTTARVPAFGCMESCILLQLPIMNVNVSPGCRSDGHASRIEHGTSSMVHRILYIVH